MTKRRLLVATSVVAIVSLSAIALGVWLRATHCWEEHDPIYATYKDLAIFVIPALAAYWAYAFQRRQHYVEARRKLWAELIEAVQGARVYTYTESPSFETWSETLSRLSVVIEKSRGVFCNVNGLFPFEPLKQVYKDIKALGYGEAATAERRKQVADAINERWKLLRRQLLRELDRRVPTYHNAWYSELKDQP